MKAVRITEYNKPLVLEDIPIPDIPPDEALVQVRACGMCRSDKAAPWAAFSIADGNLVTGQNPASAKGVAEKMMRIMEAA